MKINYTTKWIIQRFTALILIPLTFWFLYSCLSFKNFQYSEFQIFFNSYINSFLFLIMMIVMLVHAKLGCETIIQDYVSRSFIKLYLNSFINFILFLSLALVIFAIIKLSLL